MKAIKIVFSHEALVELLGLPAETIIIGAEQNVQTGAIDFCVHHAALDDLPEAYQFPRATVRDLKQMTESENKT